MTKLLIIPLIFFTMVTSPLLADVNILIIGSEKTSSDNRAISGSSQAFSPAQLKGQLKKILEGTDLGKINIVLEDTFKVQPGKVASNLISWFHWPYPANVETESRWPNLQSKKGTQWDYVVLIGDPYTIEKMPGLYSHGVAKIAEQVSKGSADVVLLMTWPGNKSESKVAHYKEVVYRTGRSGGFKVAPAGLVWEAAGKPVGDTHPSQDGAYIAAASLFCRIWNKSPKESKYSYKPVLAEVVDRVVKENIGKQQYSGKFHFQSPFKPFKNQNRSIAQIKSGGGSSTEVDFVGRTGDAVKRAGAISGKGSRYTIGRYTGSNPKTGKDFRNRGGRAFGYVYHSEGNNADSAVGNMIGWEMFLASRMIDESNEYRLIPRRVLLGSLLQFDPKMKIVGGGHVYGPQATAVGTYIYTLISGRCPIDPMPESITDQWNAQKVGYEMAWRVSNCQTRAPGFKVMPSDRTRHTIDFTTAENMTVQFMMKPVSTVTVSITTDNPAISSVSPQTLIFTPDNYNIPQRISVRVAKGAKPGSNINISYKTSSDDEVYDDLVDNWLYKVNSPPKANNLEVKAHSGIIGAITLTGSDIDEETLSYSIEKKPTNGTLNISPQGVAAYTPNKGFTGFDSFTFKTHDGYQYSQPGTVKISVSTPSLYGTNLLQNGSAELIPFSKYSWKEIKGKWQQKPHGNDGLYTFGVLDGKEAELIQNINVKVFANSIKTGKQSFKFSGHIDKSNDTVYAVVEFIDALGKVLLSCNSSEYMSKGKSRSALKLFESTQYAPPQTSVIRFRLISNNTGRGKANGGRFDKLKLEALKSK